jgi:hypothetical protein
MRYIFWISIALGLLTYHGYRLYSMDLAKDFFLIPEIAVEWAIYFVALTFFAIGRII